MTLAAPRPRGSITVAALQDCFLFTLIEVANGSMDAAATAEQGNRGVAGLQRAAEKSER
jgi:hypothetical protein